MKKSSLVFLIFCFFIVSAPRVEARSEAGNFFAAAGTAAFLLVMGKYVLPYYGQSAVNARIRVSGRNYSYPNSRISMQELCIEQVAVPKGPPWDPWARTSWRCEEKVRIRKYKDSDKKIIRLASKSYEFERIKFDWSFPFEQCKRRKLRLEIGKFGALYGWWECVE